MYSPTSHICSSILCDAETDRKELAQNYSSMKALGSNQNYSPIFFPLKPLYCSAEAKKIYVRLFGITSSTAYFKIYSSLSLAFKMCFSCFPYALISHIG